MKVIWYRIGFDDKELYKINGVIVVEIVELFELGFMVLINLLNL